jgi:hypothetical protein
MTRGGVASSEHYGITAIITTTVKRIGGGEKRKRMTGISAMTGIHILEAISNLAPSNLNNLYRQKRLPHKLIRRNK